MLKRQFSVLRRRLKVLDLIFSMLIFVFSVLILRFSTALHKNEEKREKLRAPIVDYKLTAKRHCQSICN